MSRHTRALRVVFPDVVDDRSAQARITQLEAELSALRAQQRQERHSLVPQVLVTLTPSRDAIQAELPGANGMRRVIALGRNETIEATLLRILQAQSLRAVECGEDGSPTQAQVLHWERHSEWPDDRCKFCKAEGRTLRASERKARGIQLAGDGSVQVRRLVPKDKRLSNSLRQSAEELGL